MDNANHVLSPFRENERCLKAKSDRLSRWADKAYGTRKLKRGKKGPRDAGVSNCLQQRRHTGYSQADTRNWYQAAKLPRRSFLVSRLSYRPIWRLTYILIYVRGRTRHVCVYMFILYGKRFIGPASFI